MLPAATMGLSKGHSPLNPSRPNPLKIQFPTSNQDRAATRCRRSLNGFVDGG